MFIVFPDKLKKMAVNRAIFAGLYYLYIKKLPVYAENSFVYEGNIEVILQMLQYVNWKRTEFLSTDE